VEALAVSPDYARDHTLLVSVGGEGLYRSTDGGTSFTTVGTDLIAANHDVADYTNPSGAPIQFSPAYASDRTIFAYGGQNVYRSEDRGDSWTVLDVPSATEFLRRADPALYHQRAGHGHVATTATSRGDDSDDAVVLVVGLVALAALVGAGVLASRRRGARR
jgi:hypothetical protein